MVEKRIPDPTLMARLQLSVKGIDWAASLVAHRQHEQPGGQWSAHQHLFHLLQVETQVYQPRIQQMLSGEHATFADWDEAEHMAAEYHANDDLADLADRVIAEREKSVELLKNIAPEQWRTRATWPSGEVDLAWVAERMVAHGLEHFAALLNLHQELEHFHADAWFA